MADTQAIGTGIGAVGILVVFGSAGYAWLTGITVGPYGSLPAATALLGLSSVGSLLAVLADYNGIDGVRPTLARTGSISCLGAGIVLLNPLTGTPLPVAELGVIGAVLLAAGGLVLLGSSVLTAG